MWQAFNESNLASRIRKFYLSMRTNFLISNTVPDNLAVNSLRELHLDIGHPEATHIASKFLVSGLRSLSLTLHPDGPVVRPGYHTRYISEVLSNAADSLARLEHLRLIIKDGHLLKALKPGIQEVLSRLWCLRRVEFDPEMLKPAFLYSMAGLPCLERIEAVGDINYRDCKGFDEHLDLRKLCLTDFPKLQHLAITDPSDLSFMLSHDVFRTSSLASLDLHISTLDDHDDLRDSLSYISVYCVNLQKLRVVFGPAGPFGPPDADSPRRSRSEDTKVKVDIDVLCELKLSSKLEELEIQCGPPIRLSDGDLVHMSTFWPRLHSLSLVPHSSRTCPESLPSIGALMFFAERHPNLCSLVLPFSYDLPPRAQSLPDSKITSLADLFGVQDSVLNPEFDNMPLDWRPTSLPGPIILEWDNVTRNSGICIPGTRVPVDIIDSLLGLTTAFGCAELKGIDEIELEWQDGSKLTIANPSTVSSR
jgi:hypothetical protein